MWEQSLLTSSAQVAALRLLSEWWDTSRRVRGRWRLVRVAGVAAATDERPVAVPDPAPTTS
jgi:hypothetical protein